VVAESLKKKDDDHVDLIRAALDAAVAAGTLVLVATHDQRLIDAAGTVIRLHSGRIDQAIDDPGSR